MLLSLLILGLAIKTDKDYYETGTENFTLIDVNNMGVNLFTSGQKMKSNLQAR